MRSMTYTHGQMGCLWLEVDRHGRVVIQSTGPLSRVARAGLVEDALADLARQTRTPASVLRACMLNKSAPCWQRLLARIVGIMTRAKK